MAATKRHYQAAPPMMQEPAMEECAIEENMTLGDRVRRIDDRVWALIGRLDTLHQMLTQLLARTEA